MTNRNPLTVAVLMFDQAPIFQTSVPLSVFGVDRSEMGVPRFTGLAVAGDRGPLTTTAGIRLIAPHGLDALDGAMTVIVPGWRSPTERPPERTLAALRTAHADGATIVGLCMGAFVLAAAGLLNGRRAATHWMYAPALAAAYPAVQVDASVLYADDGDVRTAAGIDACLHLVRRDFGAQIASVIARRMVIPPQRGGGQAQFIEHPLPALTRDDPLTEVLTYAITHLDDPDLDVNRLAGQAFMSRRTFDRRFPRVDRVLAASMAARPALDAGTAAAGDDRSER